MHILGAVLIAGAVGMILGAIGQATLGSKEAATEAELSSWAQRLDAAIASDLKSGAAAVKNVISEIRAKVI